MKMDFHFVVVAKMELEHEKGSPKSSLKSTSYRMQTSDNLNAKMYHEDGIPTKDGLKPVTQTLITALIANISVGKLNGWWADYEHMQYIFEELQKQFVEQTGEPEIGKMEY